MICLIVRNPITSLKLRLHCNSNEGYNLNKVIRLVLFCTYSTKVIRVLVSINLLVSDLVTLVVVQLQNETNLIMVVVLNKWLPSL